MPLLEVGPPDFLIYGFYSFIVCMYEFSFILAYGSEANALDTKIKEYLLNFTQECSDSRHLGMEEAVWEKDGKIYILRPTEEKNYEGTYTSFEDGKVYPSLDGKPAGFTSKNEELIEKQEVIKEEIGIAIERLDYKLENQQLSIFGFVMNFELIYNIFTLIVASVGSIVQTVVQRKDGN